MKVTEIIATVLGESTRPGSVCVLVRFTGCSLRCVYCDTAHAFSGGTEMTPGEVARHVAAQGIDLVLLTGGEPVEQEELPQLIGMLHSTGHELLLETNGARPLGAIDRRVVKIMDIKCPGSGEGDATDWGNVALLEEEDEVKFVVTTREDYEWAKRVIAARLGRFDGTILFSAAGGFLDAGRLGRWIVEDRLRARLQIQLHKALWPEKERGV